MKPRITVLGITALLLVSALLVTPQAEGATTVYEFGPPYASTLAGTAVFYINVSSDVDNVIFELDDIFREDMRVGSTSAGVTQWYIYLYTWPYSDGTHVVHYTIEDWDTGEVTNKSIPYIFDNTAPEVSNITVHYGEYEAANQFRPIWVTVEASDPHGVDSLFMNASSAGGPAGIMYLYDDGRHNDYGDGDGIYGGYIFYASASNGYHTATISALDRLVNEKEYTFNIAVDNVAPTVTDVSVLIPSGQTAIGPGETFRIRAAINDNPDYPPSGITRAYADASELGITEAVPLYDDGMHSDSLAGDGIYASEELILPNVPDGLANISVWAVDVAGNPASSTANTTIDGTSPHITSISVSYPSGQTWAKDGDSVSISVQAADSGSGISKVVLDASAIGGDDSTELSLSGSSYVSPQITVSSGLYTGALRVKATAYDNAGNSAVLYADVILNNTEEANDSGGTPPQEDENLPPVIDSISISDGQTLSGEVTVSMTVSDDAAIPDTYSNPLVYVDGTAINMDLTAGSTDTYSAVIDTTVYSDGMHSVTFFVLDAEGLSSGRSVSIYTDNTPPSVGFASPPDDPASGTVRILAYASDMSGISSVSLSVDHGAPMSMVPGEGATYYLDMDTTSLTDGDHVLVVSATDSMGLSASSEQVFMLVDNTPPSIRYTGSQPIEQDEGISFRISGASSAWMRVNGGDWISLSLDSTNITVYPGSLVSSSGTHYVEIRAEDRAGNGVTLSEEIEISMTEQDEGSATRPVEDEGSSMERTITLFGALLSLLLAVLTILLAMYLRDGRRVHTSTDIAKAEERGKISENEEKSAVSGTPSEENPLENNP